MKILIFVLLILFMGCTTSSRLNTYYKAKRQVGCARF